MAMRKGQIYYRSNYSFMCIKGRMFFNRIPINWKVQKCYAYK